MEETTSTASARQESVNINLFAEKTLQKAASAVLVLGIIVAVLGLLMGISEILNGNSFSIVLILCGVSVLILSLLIYSGIKVFADMSVTLKEINAKLK
ncbi:unknown [Bacteroides sp. CAG:709]|nr:unknown [Bacteroides sp. CAG:709]